MSYRAKAHLESLGERERAQFLASHLSIGYHPETEDTMFVPQIDRFSGIYVSGLPGSGKSGFLETLIAADIAANKAVIVIDPHGDLVQNCIAALPEDKVAKTYQFDMEDEAYPFGIDVFGGQAITTSAAETRAVDRMMHALGAIWKDVLQQQHFPRYVRMATLVLLANPGSTLVDMYRLLLDDTFRAKRLSAVTDKTVKDWWQTNYDNLAEAIRIQRISPLLNRLESIFMGRKIVRNILAQAESAIDFSKAILNKEILFIKLPVKLMEQDARLIGTFLVAQIHAALFSFADLPQKNRPKFSLYVDEFQLFASRDFEELFSEGRKFGICVATSNQKRDQLPDYLQSTTMMARTKVCFRLIHNDAREMAHEFQEEYSVVRPEDIEPNPVEWLLTYGSNNSDVQTFVDKYLRMLPTQHRKHGGIEVITPGFRIENVGLRASGLKPLTERPIISDPVPFLNHLLYDAMKSGSGEENIPLVIARGFSNCGYGFYATLRYWLDKHSLLSPYVAFPPKLVTRNEDGQQRWERLPRNSREQMYHFLFFLRQTMRHLAKEPVGEKKTLSTSEVAHMLTQLPRRAAFVRSGEDIGVIYTHDTPEPIEAGKLTERLAVIQEQTRLKYCKPRTEIEEKHKKEVEAVEELQAARPRWEEVE